MCGLIGIIAGPGRAVDVDELARMSLAVAHRGPDDQGAAAWSTEHGLIQTSDALRIPPGRSVGLAHRRLSIIDTGTGGHQPMATDDGRHVLITNGEIYNYRELRHELQNQGVIFKTESDTEIMLHALRTWGAETALRRFVGMFAFAFLDTTARTVTLGRDPFGIKPLVWTERDGDLAFASEPAALLEMDGLSRAANPQSIYDFLRFGLTDHGEASMFRAIRHLSPASYAIVSLDHIQAPAPQSYWHPSIEQTTDISFDDAADELRRLFLKSIELHLRADVPVGAALSGGIDSSAVVAAMRTVGGKDLKLQTFSFTAPGTPADETKWINLASADVAAKNKKTSASSEDLSRDVDNLIRTQGEPFGSTSIYAQNRVYRLVRESGIKVTLDGQGADEALGGYIPFLAARLASDLRAGRICSAVKFLYETRGMAGPGGQMARAARFMLPLGLQAVARRAVGEELIPRWMNKQWFERRDVHARAPQHPRKGRVLTAELAESLHSRVLPALLRYQDRNSMAYSIESRVPFLTTPLIDFIYSLPESFLINNYGETKSVFRAAMRGLVPDAILNRRDKIGFIPPQDDWLRGASSWMSSTFDSAADSIPAVNVDTLKAKFENNLRRDAPLPKHVWRAASLIRWANLFSVDFSRE